MLDGIDLTATLPKEVARPVLKAQVNRLYELASLLYERKVPAVIVFEGWDAVGKGTMIRRLTQQLDPRGFKVLATQAARTHEKQKPWLWRFWMQIPRRGQIAIFDRSWYGRVLVERVEGLTPIPDWIRAYEEINGFERTLADDGTIFAKFWLHIDKQEQLRRFIALTQDPETAWQVTAEDWEHHRKYDEYLAAVRDMLANTHTEYAPWSVVPATDRHYTAYYTTGVVINRLEAALGFDLTSWETPDALAAQVEDRAAEKAQRKAARKAEKARQKNQEGSTATPVVDVVTAGTEAGAGVQDAATNAHESQE